MKIFALVFLSLLLTSVPNVYGQVVENNYMNTLFLNKDQALLLPVFDTSSILNSSIDKIVLSLYVLDINSAAPNVHFTINLFDTQTKQINDGVSIFRKPQKDGYIDFELQRELFKKAAGTVDKRFLLKIVNPDTNITFAGVNDASTDPVLVIVHSEKLPHKEPESPAVKNYNFTLFSTTQFSYGSGDNIVNANNENLLSKMIWWLMGIAGSIIASYLLYRWFKIR